MGRRELVKVLKDGIFNAVEDRVMSIEFENFDRNKIELKELLKIKNYFIRIEFKYYDKQLFMLISYYTYSDNINIDVDEVDEKIKRFVPSFLFNKLAIMSDIKYKCECDSIRVEREYDGFNIEKSVNFVYWVPFDLTLTNNFNKVEEIVYNEIKENYNYYKFIRNNKYFLNLYIKEEHIKEEKLEEKKSIDIKKAKGIGGHIEIDVFIMKGNKKIMGEISTSKNGTYYKFWINKSEESIVEIIDDNFIKDIEDNLTLKTIIENDYKLKELIKLIETRIEEVELLHLLLSS